MAVCEPRLHSHTSCVDRIPCLVICALGLVVAERRPGYLKGGMRLINPDPFLPRSHHVHPDKCSAAARLPLQKKMPALNDSCELRS